MHRYLSVDIICLKRGTVFQGWGSRKSVPFKECKMSKDKYGRLISSHMEAVVVIILQIILLKCLQMSYCLLHLLFTFQCSLVGPWFRGTFFFQIKSIDKPNVYIRNYVGVREKLKKLYEGGPEKLQVCVESRMILWFELPNNLKGFDSLYSNFWNIIW